MSQHCIDDDDRFTYYHCYYHFQHYCFILLFYVLFIIVSIMFQHHRWGAVNRCRHSREQVRNRFQQPMHFCISIKKSFWFAFLYFFKLFNSISPPTNRYNKLSVNWQYDFLAKISCYFSFLTKYMSTISQLAISKRFF